jgi:Phage tail tube protein, GTA-gp10
VSGDGTLTRNDWGREVQFRLAIGECQQLQDIINRPRIEIGMPPLGPASLLRLLISGDAWTHEVREVIRLGLIGAGMKSDRAMVLIKRHVDPPGCWQQASAIAAAILSASLLGAPDDPVGKIPTPPQPETAEMDQSGSVNSTGSVLQ